VGSNASAVRQAQLVLTAESVQEIAADIQKKNVAVIRNQKNRMKLFKKKIVFNNGLFLVIKV
jgi:ABC-type phosphate transport system auxiliary subunit